MHLPNLFNGFGMGLALGVVIGVTWEHSYEMIREALRLRRTRRERMTMGEGTESNDRKWLRRLGILLAFTSVMMVVMGGAMLYLNSRLVSFINCQGTYNSQSSEARKARLHAANLENTAFYDWLGTLPPLVSPRTPGSPPNQADIKNFRQELQVAIATHLSNVQAQKNNPYPPDPKDTCGEY